MKWFYCFLLCFAACTHDPMEKNQPEFRPKIYAGSMIENAIVRKQDNEAIQCTDKKFNGFACLSYSDLLCVQEIIDACERFTTNVVSCKK